MSIEDEMLRSMFNKDRRHSRICPGCGAAKLPFLSFCGICELRGAYAGVGTSATTGPSQPRIDPDVLEDIMYMMNLQRDQQRAPEDQIREQVAKQDEQRAQAKRAAEAAAAKQKHAEDLRRAADSFKTIKKQAAKYERDAANAKAQQEAFAKMHRETFEGMFEGFFYDRGFTRQAHGQAQPPAPPPKPENNTIDLDMPMLRRLIQLCHPDKHNGSEGSQIATRFLLNIKAKLEGGR